MRPSAVCHSDGVRGSDDAAAPPRSGRRQTQSACLRAAGGGLLSLALPSPAFPAAPFAPAFLALATATTTSTSLSSLLVPILPGIGALAAAAALAPSSSWGSGPVLLEELAEVLHGHILHGTDLGLQLIDLCLLLLQTPLQPAKGFLRVSKLPPNFASVYTLNKFTVAVRSIGEH